MKHQRRVVCGHLLAPLVVLLMSVAAGACGGDRSEDPKDFYKELVDAVRRRDGAFMYDVLDSTRRSEIDTLIGMQMANLDKMPETERPKWEALKGKSKREIYEKILGTDDGVFMLFQGDYRIQRVDTFVVVTVQHAGQPANVMYLRPRGGRYLVSQPPRSPGAQQQQQRQAAPPQGAPGQTGSAAPPGSAAQPGQAKGSSGRTAPAGADSAGAPRRGR